VTLGDPGAHGYGGDTGNVDPGDAGYGGEGGSPTGHRGGSHRGGRGGKGGAKAGGLLGKPIGIAAAAVGILAIAAAAVVELQPSHNQNTSIAITGPTRAVLGTASASVAPSAVVIPTQSASASSSATSTTSATTGTSAKPSVTPSTRAAAPATSSKPAAPRTSAAPASSSAAAGGSNSNSASAAQQVLDVINQARAQAGLKPYTMSSNLINSAGAHNARMEDGCGLSHQCSGEAALGDRETAAGVHWTSAGENIGEGGPVGDSQSSIAQMAVSLTNSMLAEKPPNDGHRQNILSSSFTEVGIAITRDSSGTVWMTQDFAG